MKQASAQNQENTCARRCIFGIFQFLSIVSSVDLFVNSYVFWSANKENAFNIVMSNALLSAWKTSSIHLTLIQLSPSYVNESQ